jgi:hypothetical protein
MSDRILADEELDGIDKIAIDGDLVPYLQAQDAKTANYYETVVIPAELKKVTEETTIDVLHEVQKWLSGEQSKEKLAERLELDFDTLNAFLPSGGQKDADWEALKAKRAEIMENCEAELQLAIRMAINELIEEIMRDYGDPDLNKWLQQLKQKRGK